MRLDKWHLVKKSMDEFQPDVIHINSEWTIGYFGAIYCRHRHVPFVFTFHTLWEDYLANYINFVPARVNKFLKWFFYLYYPLHLTILGAIRYFG